MSSSFKKNVNVAVFRFFWLIFFNLQSQMVLKLHGQIEPRVLLLNYLLYIALRHFQLESKFRRIHGHFQWWRFFMQGLLRVLCPCTTLGIQVDNICKTLLISFYWNFTFVSRSFSELVLDRDTVLKRDKVLGSNIQFFIWHYLLQLRLVGMNSCLNWVKHFFIFMINWGS